MQDETWDVAVIGAGTAGLAATRAARDAGARVVLIDPEFAGTTCATTGCMPSKLLIAAADAAETARRAVTFGIAAPPRIDGAAVLARVRRMRDGFVAGVQEGIAEIPDRIVGRARFSGPCRGGTDAGPCTLELEAEGGTRHLRARAVVIATGANPHVPRAFAAVIDRVLTNRTIFEMEDLPASLGVIGAGPLGLELAQAMSRLGVRVAVFDKARTVAGLPDADASARFAEIVAEEFPIRLGCEPAVATASGGVELRWNGQAQVFDRLLVAAGRPPNLKELGLERTGLAIGPDGVPVFDAETMQCGDAPVFIAGDADQLRPVLHEAAAEGTIAGSNAACWPQVRRARRKVALAIAFTRPGVATVGRGPEDVTEGVVSAEADWSDQGRARVEGRAAGFCRLHARAGDGRLTGATLCLPDAEHLARWIALAIETDQTAHDLLQRPFYHPTLEEGLKPALRKLCDAVGAARPWDRDDHPRPGDRCR